MNPNRPITALASGGGRSTSANKRAGKALALVAIMLPTLFAVAGLVFDAGTMLATRREMQNAADAAVSAAAMDLSMANGSQVNTTAALYVQQLNGLADATVTVNDPPTSGAYAGVANHLELVVEQDVTFSFASFLGVSNSRTISVRSVAAYRAATTGAAVVVLDTDPAEISLPVVLSAIGGGTALLGGLEILGLGGVEVDGAILVNTPWGGYDQDGNPAGENSGPPYGIACTPILPLTRLAAEDIRVSGGVDDPDNYSHTDPGESSPLEASRLPIPDPLADLPVPTLTSDPTNVQATNHGGVLIATLPILPRVHLWPGVYDWLEIRSGRVTLNPGVYIIRSQQPLTGAALTITGGQVLAEGVMFYITNESGYDPAVGLPDSTDGETKPPHLQQLLIAPSVVLNSGLLSCSFTGLDDPSSPYDGILLFQRRFDRRPVVIVDDPLLGTGPLSGTIYAKWGHVTFAGHGTYDVKIVAGTVRIVSEFGVELQPSVLLPPALDVFLVE